MSTNKTADRKFVSMLKIFYIALITATCFRFSISTLHYGLDQSWEYALNLFFRDGRLWGHSVIFTYGPLGFLLKPLPIGNNILWALIFWIVITVFACILFSYVMFSRKLADFNSRYTNLFASFILFYLGAGLFRALDSQHIITFLMLSLLSICWWIEDCKFFVIACALAVLSMFMKFNHGAENFIMLVIFTCLVIFRRRGVLHYVIALCCVPVLFAVCFLIYNPSFSELVYYIRGAYEISSGYNFAMSFPLQSLGMSIIYMSLFAVILFIILQRFSFFRTRHSLSHIMIFAASLFMLFKHGFVRAHNYHEFAQLFYVYTSLYILFMKDELAVSIKFDRFMKSCMCILFCSTLLMSCLITTDTLSAKLESLSINPHISEKIFYHTKTFLANPLTTFIEQVKAVRIHDKVQDDRKFHMPESIKHNISGQSFAVYPWEISYIADMHDNYKTMPIFQAYSAYTVWLDEQNAKFFADDNTAPNFVIFNLNSIDGRFALLECPQTWLEIFRHYRINMISSDDISVHDFLLERRRPQKLITRKISTERFSRDEKISIPDTKSYCLMNLHMPMNLTGKLAKLFFKLPEVFMTVEFDDGRIITKRIIIDTLAGDTLINLLPIDEDSFAQIMNGDMNTNRVRSFSFNGPGLKYYSNYMEVSFSEAVFSD